MSMLKQSFRTLASAAIGVALSAAIAFEAHAEMAQTDVALVQQMGEASSDKKLQALGLYYDLHVSELTVQNMNERRTGAMFAVMRAKGANKGPNVIAKLEKQAQQVMDERAAKVKENQNLRIELGNVSGLDFSDPLVMAPDVPMDTPVALANLSADLAAERKQAWDAFMTAHAAWQEERLILLDAQQRYDETRDVPIGDHLRAMTRAEITHAKAIGAFRLVEAKIAVATGKPLVEVLGAL